MPQTPLQHIAAEVQLFNGCSQRRYCVGFTASLQTAVYRVWCGLNNAHAPNMRSLDLVGWVEG
ncbi:MAG: hypothetical protein RID09_29980 [Coleofasciculus sp. G1-WW12-02]